MTVTSDTPSRLGGLYLPDALNPPPMQIGADGPRRVQRKRTSGWRMPENTVQVGRGSRWGNPFRWHDETSGLVRFGPAHAERFGRAWDFEGRVSGNGNRHDLWLDRADVVRTDVRWATRPELVELFYFTLVDPTPSMRMAYPSAHGRFAWCSVSDIQRELAGKNLACWCAEDSPWCHAGVLLYLANTALPPELLAASCVERPLPPR